jgi:hypothetical protein
VIARGKIIPLKDSAAGVRLGLRTESSKPAPLKKRLNQSNQPVSP